MKKTRNAKAPSNLPLLIASHTFLVAFFTNPYVISLFADVHRIFSNGPAADVDISTVVALSVLSEVMFLISLFALGTYILRKK